MIKKIVFFSLVLSSIFSNIAVTFNDAGGRFGDNLICYLHGKWISYKYNIDFIYRGFIYSKMLKLDDLETRYNVHFVKKYFDKTVLLTNDIKIDKNKDRILYLVDYFPETYHDRRIKYWPCLFDIDWNDDGFFEIMHEFVCPKENVISEDRVLDDRKINIAVHYREGGGFDDDNAKVCWPLKFPSINYYIRQINFILKKFRGNNFYIYLFTDAKNTEEIANKIKKNIKTYDNVIVDYRKNNVHNANVLEDFFFMMKFSCIIRSDSNYSIIAAKMGRPIIEIYPIAAKRIKNVNEVTKVKIVYNNKEIL